MLYCNSLFKHAYQPSVILSAAMLAVLVLPSDGQAGSHAKKGRGAEASTGGTAAGEAKAYGSDGVIAGYIGRTGGFSKAQSRPRLEAQSGHRSRSLAMARNSHGQAKVHTSAFAKASAARIGKHKFMATAGAFAIGDASALSATEIGRAHV